MVLVASFGVDWKGLLPEGGDQPGVGSPCARGP